VRYIFDRYNILDVLLPCVFLLSIFATLFFHYKTHRSLWQDYKILFFRNSDASSMEETIKDAKIQGAITKNSMSERFDTNDEPITLKELYVQWFENELDNLSYIYIPKATYVPFSFLKSLRDKNIPFYLEGEPHLSYINFFSTIFLFFLFLMLSNRKCLFFFVNLPFLPLSFIIRGELMFAFVFLFLLGSFYIIELIFEPSYLNAEQRRVRIKKNLSIFAIPIIAYLLVLFDTYISYIYIFFSSIASISSIYVIEKFRYLLEKEQDANMVHRKVVLYSMHPVFTECISSRKKILISIVFFVIAYVPHIIFNLYFLSPMPKSYTNVLSLPMPSSANRTEDFSTDSLITCYQNRSGDALPDLSTYIYDVWIKKTEDYVSVNQKKRIPQKNEKLIFRDYYNEGDGIIKEKEGFSFSFDNNFIRENLKNVKMNTIERMLISEGGFVSSFYNFRLFQITYHDKIPIIISLCFVLISLGIVSFKVIR